MGQIPLVPGGEEIIGEIVEHLKVITSISSMVAEGMTPEQILGVRNMEVLESVPVHFQCQCPEERIRNTIISL